MTFFKSKNAALCFFFISLKFIFSFVSISSIEPKGDFLLLAEFDDGLLANFEEGSEEAAMTTTPVACLVGRPSVEGMGGRAFGFLEGTTLTSLLT